MKPTVQELHRELMRLASDLACGRLLPNIDTDVWRASTTMTERRRITRPMDAAEEAHKVLALQIRKLADRLPGSADERRESGK